MLHISPLGVPYVTYGLKIVDKNGEFSYSNIIIISIPDVLITKVNLFPNPAENKIIVSITSPKDQQINWQLIDNAEERR